MRKRFLHNKYGMNEQFWDQNWMSSFSSAGAVLNVNHKLAMGITRHLPPGSLILEGGCGDCQYVRYLDKAGFRVIGVDFAESTVRDARHHWPHLDIRVGNIRGLDFPVNYFDGYYSGGVIEHFEDGLTPQLSEAFRVLKPGGLFLVTVPHLNVSRQLSALVSTCRHKTDLDGRVSTHRDNVETFYLEQAPAGFHFHEYVLNSSEMRQHLYQAGFEIIEEVPFSLRWGLLDIEWFQNCYAPVRQNRNVFNKAFGAMLHTADVIEQRGGAIASKVSNFLGEMVGNMKLYICSANKE